MGRGDESSKFAGPASQNPVGHSWQLTWLPVSPISDVPPLRARHVSNFFPEAVATQKTTPPGSPPDRPITASVKTTHTCVHLNRPIKNSQKDLQRCHLATPPCPPLTPAEQALASDRSIFARSLNLIGSPTNRLRGAAWRISVSRKIEPETVKFGGFWASFGIRVELLRRTHCEG